MGDVIIHGWGKPNDCIECPFKVTDSINLGNATVQTIYACPFNKEEDPWRSSYSMYSKWLYNPCPIEEVSE